MWIFNLFTEYITHAIFFIGVLGLVVGTMLGVIPFVDKYKLPIQLIGGLLFILGVYLEGGLAKDKEWEIKAADAKVEAAKKEVEAADKTAEVQTQVIEKIKVVREKGRTITEYVDKVVYNDVEVVKYVERCPMLPKKIVEVHNKAVDNEDVSGEIN